MASDDLILEFEDEDEEKATKTDDILAKAQAQFASPDPAKPAKATAAAVPKSATPPATPTVAPVKKIEEARAAAQGTSPSIKRPVAAAAPVSVGATAMKIQPQPQRRIEPQFESDNVAELQERLRQTEVSAEIRVGVAEYKVELLSELLSDIKLMDHQINQLLTRMHTKHPDMKQEILMIKKILADFSAKKRK